MAAEPEGSARDLILVTGASGFLGAAIANSARAAGYAVRVLVRSTSPRINIHREDEIALGDLRDGAAVAAALRGVRYLIHAAADYRLWAPVPDDIVRNNVEGTRTLMQEALRAGVERIVYTSSVATIGHGDGKPADESRLLPPDEAVGAYKKSKVLAERLVHEMVVRQGLPAVVVNPSTPIGPRDVKPTPTGRIIVEAARGRMPGFVDTGLNLVHVDDVATGHLLAEGRGRLGERYILGGEDMTLAEILQRIAVLTARRPPRWRLPIAAIWPIALIAEGMGRFSGREPFVTLDGLRMARKKMFFSSAKAVRELGYAPRPAEAGLADAIAWFRQAGMCP